MNKETEGKNINDIAKLYEEGCAEVDRQLGDGIKDGESVLERLKLSNKLIHGYNQFYPIERALGFKRPQGMSVYPVSSHVMNVGDIEIYERLILMSFYRVQILFPSPNRK